MDTRELGHNHHNTAPSNNIEKRANTKNVTNILSELFFTNKLTEMCCHIFILSVFWFTLNK